VSRRSARPFASSADWGLQQNGRPSPRGTVRLRRMDRVLVDGLRNHGHRVIVKERAI
jgi:hypothetical protein